MSGAITIQGTIGSERIDPYSMINIRYTSKNPAVIPAITVECSARQVRFAAASV